MTHANDNAWDMQDESNRRFDESGMRAVTVTALPRRFTLRVGTREDLDTLAAIDSDACELFVRAGLDVELADQHEFIRAERARWLTSLVWGDTLLALSSSGEPIGFAAAGTRDGEPYLDQLSVRQSAMGIGVGSALLSATWQKARAAGAHSLWLTTYRHLSWNQPFYERRGFVAVPETRCGPEMRAELEFERRWLPAPGERVAMRKIFPPNT
jgi:GNAT superfamily N-acetyltransferase